MQKYIPLNTPEAVSTEKKKKNMKNRRLVLKTAIKKARFVSQFVTSCWTKNGGRASPTA